MDKLTSPKGISPDLLAAAQRRRAKRQGESAAKAGMLDAAPVASTRDTLSRSTSPGSKTSSSPMGALSTPGSRKGSSSGTSSGEMSDDESKGAQHPNLDWRSFFNKTEMVSAGGVWCYSDD